LTIHVENRITRYVLLAALAFALVAIPIASGGAELDAGSLALHAELHVAGAAVTCPPGVPPEADFSRLAAWPPRESACVKERSASA